MTRLPKIDSDGLRLAKREAAKRVRSSVARVSKRETCLINGKMLYCDWEYNPMHGGNECNACGSFSRRS